MKKNEKPKSKLKKWLIILGAVMVVGTVATVLGVVGKNENKLTIKDKSTTTTTTTPTTPTPQIESKTN